MKKTINRWVYVIAGTIALMFAGMGYAWTVISNPISLQYPVWTKAELSLTFTIMIMSFCTGGFVGGQLQKKIKPNLLLWFAAILYIVGLFLTAKATNLAMLYIGFGVCSGFASGFVYNGVISTVNKWFPDKQGLASGILLMGYGMGSFLVGKIFTYVTPSDGTSLWRQNVLVFGIMLFLVMAIASFFVVRPTEDFKPPISKSKKKIMEPYEEINTAQMLKKPSLWLFMVWTLCFSASGLMIISQGSPLAFEACPNLSMSTVATIVGLISVFSGLGRIVFGLVFDKFGRVACMLGGAVVFVVGLLLIFLSLVSGSEVILTISYMVLGLGYGCVPPTNATFVTLFYGRKYYPTNFSIITMNLLIASFASTLAGFLFDSTGSYYTTPLVAIGIVVVGTVAGLLIKKPKVE